MDNIKIRKVTPLDAGSLLEVAKQIDVETTFMLRKSGERKTTAEEQKKNIENLLQKNNQMIFVAEDNGSIVGYLMCIGGQFKMTEKTAIIVVGILQSYVGKHIGTMLFEVMEDWAKSAGIHRLELKVDDGNESAMALYKKMGFVVEGITKDSTFVDGKYRDAYLMGKII